MNGLVYLATLLASGAVVVVAYRLLKPGAEVLRCSLRALGCFVVLAFGAVWLDNVGFGIGTFPLDGIMALALLTLPGLWCALLTRGPPTRPVIVAIGSAVVVAMIAPPVLGIAGAALPRMVLAFGVVITHGLAAAMQVRRLAWWRTILHASVTLPILSVGLPLLILATLVPGAVMKPPGEVCLAWALLAATLGSVLFTQASLPFIRAGFTPDPWDCPDRLLSKGVYAHIRNPMQIAEILFVLAAACVFGSPWIWCYGAIFALVLVGPLRVIEEYQLVERFGDAARDYIAHVPAFIPRHRTNLTPEQSGGA